MRKALPILCLFAAAAVPQYLDSQVPDPLLTATGQEFLRLSTQEKPAAPPGPAKVVIVPIVDEIDLQNMALVLRAAGRIKAEKPALVIFEIDTPGGRIDYMLNMGEAIMNLAPIPTVAYVRPPAKGDVMGGAISAGSYLAFSCKKIYMYPGTVIGAATPVHQTAEGGIEAAGEKILSVFRAKMQARAEQNGYPPNVAAAMVDMEVELFEVDIDGKKQYLTEPELNKLRDQGKKFDWPSSPKDPKNKLLTMRDQEVAAIGMGKIASDRTAIYSDHGIASPVEILIESSWSEAFVGFITSGLIRTVLLVVGILGIWVEFKTPGFGVPGVVGVLALGLLFFGHHLAGLAEMGELVLLVLGMMLVIAELLFFPGVGIGVGAGILCIFAALILSFQDFTIPDPTGAPWQVDVLLSSLGQVMVSFLGAAIGLILVLRFLPRVPMIGRVVLQADLGSAVAPAEQAALVGKEGHAATPLRPGGKIEIEGQTYDVVADGEFVAKGEPVQVLRAEGIRIVVGRLKR